MPSEESKNNDGGGGRDGRLRPSSSSPNLEGISSIKEPGAVPRRPAKTTVTAYMMTDLPRLSISSSDDDRSLDSIEFTAKVLRGNLNASFGSDFDASFGDDAPGGSSRRAISGRDGGGISSKDSFASIEKSGSGRRGGGGGGREGGGGGQVVPGTKRGTTSRRRMSRRMSSLSECDSVDVPRLDDDGVLGASADAAAAAYERYMDRSNRSNNPSIVVGDDEETAAYGDADALDDSISIYDVRRLSDSLFESRRWSGGDSGLGLGDPIDDGAAPGTGRVGYGPRASVTRPAPDRHVPPMMAFLRSWSRNNVLLGTDRCDDTSEGKYSSDSFARGHAGRLGSRGDRRDDGSGAKASGRGDDSVAAADDDPRSVATVDAAVKDRSDGSRRPKATRTEAASPRELSRKSFGEGKDSRYSALRGHARWMAVCFLAALAVSVGMVGVLLAAAPGGSAMDEPSAAVADNGSGASVSSTSSYSSAVNSSNVIEPVPGPDRPPTEEEASTTTDAERLDLAERIDLSCSKRSGGDGGMNDAGECRSLCRDKGCCFGDEEGDAGKEEVELGHEAAGGFASFARSGLVDERQWLANSLETADGASAAEADGEDATASEAMAESSSAEDEHRDASSNKSCISDPRQHCLAYAGCAPLFGK